MNGKYQITGRQVSAARALLAIPQDELARAAGVSLSTLRRFEGMSGHLEGIASNVAAVQRALEAAGVEFTNGDGPGVKLRKAPRGDPAASIKVEDLTAENDE